MMQVTNSHLVEAIAYWRRNPVQAIKDWFGVTPEDYQGEILTDLLAMPGVRRVVAKSAHGVGKTTTESWANWVYMVTRAHCRIVATAPTQSQLKDILWPECAKWHQRMPEQLRAMFDINETHIRHKESPKTWFATARTSNKQENLQGFHGDNILVLADEASGIPQNVFEVIEGILTGAAEEGLEAGLFMAGNPTQTAGEFYNAFHRNKSMYSRFTITGDLVPPKDPNGGKIYVSRRVSDNYRQNMAKKYGVTSGVYAVRVSGLFPTADDRVVIGLGIAENGTRTELPKFDRVAHAARLVMDVARFGGDETVLGKFRGNHCLWMKVWPKTSTVECVNILYDHYYNNSEDDNISEIIIDEPGVGGGVIDLARNRGMPITAYNGGASVNMENGDPEDDIRMFANRRSRDWWHARLLFEKGLVHIPDDEALVNQLASVKYEYNQREKIQVESKREMRERLGEDASPDRADVIIMGLAPHYSLINSLPRDIVDLAHNLHYGNMRPTAEQDFRDFS